MRSQTFNLPMQMLLIAVTGGVLAGTANLIHPERIPWIQDWDNYVEAKAKRAGIDVIPLNRAYFLYNAGDHLFVDARPAERYRDNHIPRALSLPFEGLTEHFSMFEHVLSTNMPLVIYCRNRECDDALLLASELRDMGKSNILYYVDGFELWEESECPVESL